MSSQMGYHEFLYSSLAPQKSNKIKLLFKTLLSFNPKHAHSWQLKSDRWADSAGSLHDKRFSIFQGNRLEFSYFFHWQSYNYAEFSTGLVHRYDIYKARPIPDLLFIYCDPLHSSTPALKKKKKKPIELLTHRELQINKWVTGTNLNA